MTDSRELAHPAAQPPAVRQSENLLAQVIAAAQDPNIDAAKMETLARLVNSQQDREREIEFNRAKNAAIMEMPVITKDGKIVIRKQGEPERLQGRFAKWEDIDRVVRPILQRHGLALSFDQAEREGGGLLVFPILSHVNGYTERGGGFPVPAEISGSKNAAQAMGSSQSYGKRYAGCGMLNIVTEGVDDDGNGGRNAVVTLPYEREQLVREEAEAAANEGKYVEWFSQQSPKDRAWLVNQQFHVDFGGQPLITATPKARTAPPPPPPPGPPPPPPPPPSEATGADTGQPATKRTPEQMVEDFKKQLDGAATSKEIVDLQAQPKVAQWIDTLEQRYPHLYQKVVDHAAQRYADLNAKEREVARAGGGLV